MTTPEAILKMVREDLDRASLRWASLPAAPRGRNSKALEAATAERIALANVATKIRLAIDGSRDWPGYGYELSASETRIRKILEREERSS